MVDVSGGVLRPCRSRWVPGGLGVRCPVACETVRCGAERGVVDECSADVAVSGGVGGWGSVAWFACWWGVGLVGVLVRALDGGCVGDLGGDRERRAYV